MSTDATFTDLTRRLDYPMYLVTVAAGHERAGCLIGFATQCSIDPPHFFACLSNKNRTLRLALTSSAMAVHLVPRRAQHLARLFGGETGDETDKFSRCAWHEGPRGLPILEECGSWFAGLILRHLELGDHVGFLLEPFAAQHGQATEPLLFFSQVSSIEPGHPA